MYCQCFHSLPVFSLLLMSTPCFIVFLREKREHHCRDDYFLKRRFVRQGDKNYRLLWLLRQIAYKLFIFSLLLKLTVITKTCPSVMFITIQYQAAPLLCFHLSHCLSVSLLLSFCTPSSSVLEYSVPSTFAVDRSSIQCWTCCRNYERCKWSLLAV